MGQGLKEHHITPSNHEHSTTSAPSSKQGSPKAKPEHSQVVKDAIEANLADYEYLRQWIRRP